MKHSRLLWNLAFLALLLLAGVGGRQWIQHREASFLTGPQRETNRGTFVQKSHTRADGTGGYASGRRVELSESEKLRWRLKALVEDETHRREDREIEELNELLSALSSQDAKENAAWLIAELPGYRDAFIRWWIMKDPQAALDFIADCQIENPCAADTLMWLLGRLGEKGPEALGEAVRRVRWGHFDPAYMPEYIAGGDLTEFRKIDGHLRIDGDYAVWIESGVARSLAAEGVDLRGVFGPWFSADRQAAIEGWADWPEVNSVGSAANLMEMIDPPNYDAEGVEEKVRSYPQWEDAFLNEGEKAVERLKRVVFAMKNPEEAELAKKIFPNVFPLD